MSMGVRMANMAVRATAVAALASSIVTSTAAGATTAVSISPPAKKWDTVYVEASVNLRRGETASALMRLYGPARTVSASWNLARRGAPVRHIIPFDDTCVPGVWWASISVDVAAPNGDFLRTVNRTSKRRKIACGFSRTHEMGQTEPPEFPLPDTPVIPMRVSAYGKGFIGEETACGHVLRRSSRVVAHRTWPCGTRVTVKLKGREVDAVVDDRGPFIGGRAMDLGPGVWRALGFKDEKSFGVRTVGVRVWWP